jgi:acyl-coenzyme A synthetase/AMP-(fatty) acid ligase
VDEFGSIHGPFVDVQGKRYFPTQDRLKRLEEGGYACLGRAASLVKVGGPIEIWPPSKHRWGS